MLQGVPDHQLGNSVECPRCHNSFTLAPMRDPPPAATRVVTVLPKAAPFAPPPAPAAPGTSEAVATEGTVPRTPLVHGLPPERTLIELPPEPSSPNYAALASFLLGAFAFLAAALLHAGWLTLALGLLGLILGVVAFALHSPGAGVGLPGAGVVVGLAATLIALVLPEWFGLSPIWSRTKPHQRAADVAVALSGEGGERPITEGEPEWVDASRDALIHGDIRLRISSATVGSPAFQQVSGKQPPRDRCLVLGLRVTNAGIAGKVSYAGWASGSLPQDRPILRDDQGHTYPEKVFDPIWVIKGRATGSSIPPGKTLDDVLIFEAPPSSVSHLRLELPARPLGGQGQLRMEIPRPMIAFR
jgi:hypothetical protein